ncbi:MAG: hypothetical protein ACM31L_17865 [Actinomycetota bacterium]
MVFKQAFCAVLLLTGVTAVMEAVAGGGPLTAATAQAQQMGRDPWAFPADNRTFSAQAQLLRRQQDAAGSASPASSGAAGATTAYITSYNNSSTSIGNWNDIQQTLSGGSTAYLGTSIGQTNHGNSTSNSSADTTTTTTSTSNSNNVIGYTQTPQSTQTSQQQSVQSVQQTIQSPTP